MTDSLACTITRGQGGCKDRYCFDVTMRLLFTQTFQLLKTGGTIGGTKAKVENRGECQMDRFEIYLSTLVLLLLQMSAWMKVFFGLKRSKKKIGGERH